VQACRTIGQATKCPTDAANCESISPASIGKGPWFNDSIIVTKTVGVEASGCERLAHGRYAAAPRPDLLIASPTPYRSATTPRRLRAAWIYGRRITYWVGRFSHFTGRLTGHIHRTLSTAFRCCQKVKLHITDWCLAYRGIARRNDISHALFWRVILQKLCIIKINLCICFWFFWDFLFFLSLVSPIIVLVTAQCCRLSWLYISFWAHYI